MIRCNLYIVLAALSIFVIESGCSGGDSDGGGADGSAGGDSDTDTDTDGDGDTDGDSDADTEGDTGDTDTGTDTRTDSETDTDTTSGIEFDTDSEVVVAPETVSDCFANAYLNEPAVSPDYDQFSPTVGSHCMGTNHQEIADVERVVFLGDSITVGSPPTLSNQYYRSRLANMLANRFGLPKPGTVWKSSIEFVHTPSFSSCAKWGADTSDFVEQIEGCFPEDKRDKTTLVIITMGGNDEVPTVKSVIAEEPEEQIWADVEEWVQLHREAVEWFYEDPDRFPAGVYVIFSNVYEYTDGTGKTDSCWASNTIFDDPLQDPTFVFELATWWNEQYLKLAVETGTDMIFMLERFCGHGYARNNPDAPCYRGPNQAPWFDVTCIHPTPAGHAQVANMFMAVVEE